MRWTGFSPFALFVLTHCSNCVPASTECVNSGECPKNFTCSGGMCVAIGDASVAVDGASFDAAIGDTGGADANRSDSAGLESHADSGPTDLPPVEAATDRSQPDAVGRDAVRDAGGCDAAGASADGDGDGTPDVCDNCRAMYNPTQADRDHDGVGDSCDNCILYPNPGQEVASNDTVGTACQQNDPDNDAFVTDDQDGAQDPCTHGNRVDCEDNCPEDHNPGQDDDDGDGVGGHCDNCLLVANPGQIDANENGVGDSCTDVDDDNDTVRNDDGDGFPDPCVGGSVSDCDDNCLDLHNPRQLNADWDQLGDACDPNPGTAPIHVLLQQAPINPVFWTSLVSAGEQLWMLRGHDMSLFVSQTGFSGSWSEMTGGRTISATTDHCASTSLAFDPTRQLLYAVHWGHLVDGATEVRLALYDIRANEWSWGVSTDNLAMNQNLIVVGDQLFGLQTSQEYKVRRIDLTDLPAYHELGARFSVTFGSEPDWLATPAKWAQHEGRIYGIKNDWVTSPTGSGDRLYVFDPADFVSESTVHADDLGPLPWDIGAGSTLVPLPAGWGGLVGARGGFHIIRGIGPGSDQNGNNASANPDAAIYDLATAIFMLLPLPVPMEGGTAAAFHGRSLVIKRGDAESDELYILTPTEP